MIAALDSTDLPRTIHYEGLGEITHIMENGIGDLSWPDDCVGKSRETDVFWHNIEEGFGVISASTKHYGMITVMEVRYTGDDYMPLVKLALRENVIY